MKGRRACLLGALALVLGCGSSTRTLSSADVSNLPPGTASGTEFSGTYLETSATLEGCDCRAGSCALIHAGTPGVTFTVVQQDGMVTMSSSGDTTGTPVVGSVNPDGSFSVGAVAQIPYAVGSGVIYELSQGHFNVSGGLPTGMQFQGDETIRGTVEGITYDCDVRSSNIAVYEGSSVYADQGSSGSPAASLATALAYFAAR